MVSLCDHLALRPLTLCGCDCKIITTAICFGLHRYSIRCIHPSSGDASRPVKWPITSSRWRQLALAHVACATRDSGILVTDFAAAYPSVNHSWIFHVLEKAEVPGFSCRFLRVIYCNGMMEVEFARKTRGQFLMSRGVRQGCPASRFLFAMAFRPYLSMGSTTLSSQESCRLRLSTTLSVCLRWRFCCCCFVFLDVDDRPVSSLRGGVPGGWAQLESSAVWYNMATTAVMSCWNSASTNCEEFRERKIVKYAKYVVTMIGPEGYLHRWTAPREKVHPKS